MPPNIQPLSPLVLAASPTASIVPFTSILTSPQNLPAPDPLDGSLGLFLAMLFVILTLLAVTALILYRIHMCKSSFSEPEDYSASAKKVLQSVLQQDSSRSDSSSSMTAGAGNVGKDEAGGKKDGKAKKARLRQLLLPTLFNKPTLPLTTRTTTTARTFFNFIKFRPRASLYLPTFRLPSTPKTPKRLTLNPCQTLLTPSVPSIVVSTCSPSVSTFRPLELPPGFKPSSDPSSLQVPNVLTTPSRPRTIPQPPQASVIDMSEPCHALGPNPNTSPALTPELEQGPGKEHGPRQAQAQGSHLELGTEPNAPFELISNQTGKPFELLANPQKLKVGRHTRKPSEHGKENFPSFV
ncbi:unnamed protein product [Somion occarium]|uniref:Uncharacterized protein n=1 Tax=Somion occarium TaxID=3059160 RepID=A0ABP1DQN4_9APHY